jgi:beta-lactamase regulating signal transducer with metallopeptidase domain
MIDTVLLNGLWQGALISAIAVVIAFWVPQRHAATRYAIWFSALLALALLPALTLWHPEPATATLPMLVAHTAAAPTVITAEAASRSGLWLPGLWLGGVALCLLRLAGSSLRTQRVVRAATPALDLGPDVVVTNELTYPIAAGLIAPKIMLPAHLLTTLQRSDLESIVRHERAHIARQDIFTNLVQRLIEACLFFNPWVYVIGRQLIKEREAACDDYAVDATGEADRYATCLAQLAQTARPQKTPLLTPSAIGSRRMLVGRIARLLNGKATQLKINYFVLGASVMSFAALAFFVQTANGLAAVSLAATNPNIPACAHDIKVVDAVAPDIAKADFKPNVESGVLVTIDATGHVVDEKIVLSSGSTAIDKATLEAARKSTYGPAVGMNCQPTAGHYYFHIATGPH